MRGARRRRLGGGGGGGGDEGGGEQRGVAGSCTCRWCGRGYLAPPPSPFACLPVSLKGRQSYRLHRSVRFSVSPFHELWCCGTNNRTDATAVIAVQDSGTSGQTLPLAACTQPELELQVVMVEVVPGERILVPAATIAM
ncbi:hypothetical protein E2C01_086740 [Portunus trituberculatus]|uniref:Uncharacterized protein n=1 Tax=Portunus trituberculatus TaxID=210409 RepID=A0A5B7JAJ4_PORTR|nr:hypothetical protein [Portunus trituberculatus]